MAGIKVNNIVEESKNELSSPDFFLSLYFVTQNGLDQF